MTHEMDAYKIFRMLKVVDLRVNKGINSNSHIYYLFSNIAYAYFAIKLTVQF